MKKKILICVIVAIVLSMAFSIVAFAQDSNEDENTLVYSGTGKVGPSTVSNGSKDFVVTVDILWTETTSYVKAGLTQTSTQLLQRLWCSGVVSVPSHGTQSIGSATTYYSTSQLMWGPYFYTSGTYSCSGQFAGYESALPIASYNYTKYETYVY